jgi:hypothetical protein
VNQVRTLRQKSARIPNPTLSELQNFRGKCETGGNDQTRPPRGRSKKNAAQFFLSIPGTDISRSLVAVGREFAFPIDYSTEKHWELVSSPNTVTTYSKDLAKRLAATRKVAELLVKEHRGCHREFINANRPNPWIYAIGDIVFARQAVRSDKRRERVDKLQYAFTGPWKVVSVMPSASYGLEHCEQAGRKDPQVTCGPFP